MEQQNQKTLNKEEIDNAKEERRRHNLMVETITEIISYLSYVVLILIAANSATDANSFRFRESLKDIFLNSGDIPFTEVIKY